MLGPRIVSLIASMGGMGAIFMMESTKRVLIPDWEQSLPPEAQTPAPASASASAD